jgi:hypothetical protein
VLRRSLVYSINHWVIKYALLSGCVHCGVGVCSDGQSPALPALSAVRGTSAAFRIVALLETSPRELPRKCEFKGSSERQVPSVATDNP